MAVISATFMLNSHLDPFSHLQSTLIERLPAGVFKLKLNETYVANAASVNMSGKGLK